MTRQLLTVLLALAFCLAGQAQTIDTALLKTYPASVITRVHDVASKVNLSSGEQELLADLFTGQEQDLATLVLNGAAPAAIDSLKLMQLSEFNSMLASQKIDSYYTIKSAGKANTIGQLMAEMLGVKYSIDSITQQYFATMYKWQESLIEKLWISNADTVIRNNNISAALYVYDTLISKYLHAVESSNYVERKIFYIDSLLPIESANKDSIRSNYYTNCITYKNRSYTDNFNNAFRTVFSSITDTAYYAVAYGYEVGQTANAAAQAALAGYVTAYKLSDAASHQISPYLLQRERAIALLNKLYPDFTDEKGELLNEILVTYQPAIDSLIAQDGDVLHASQIDIAIKFSRELGLDSGQVIQLHEALDVLRDLQEAHRLDDPYGEYDSKVFESEQLNAILTPEQYTQVLTVKFYSKSAGMAQLDWEYLVLYDMVASNGFTEAGTKTELTNYHLAVLIAYYRHANNLEEQYLSVQAINEVMPEAMQLLLEQWAYMTPYGDTPDVFFQW